MKIVRKPWFLPVLFTCVIIVAGAFYIGNMLSKEELLSDSQIRAQLETIYGGTVDELSLENDIYQAEMTRNGAVYSAEISGVTGKVLSLMQLSEPIEEPPVSEPIEEPLPNKPVEETPSSKPVEEAPSSKPVEKSPQAPPEKVQKPPANNVLITREKAIGIARGRLRGEVEDVEFKKTNDGGYYLIEIEQDNDNGDDLEAVFQIHAITGKIMSEDWDN